MKILLSIILLATFHLASGQPENQKDLVEILNIALRDNQFPNELIKATNPDIAPWTNAPFIVVKADKSINLERLSVPPDSTHVWIFDYEDIFVLEISYVLVPLNISRKKDQLTLDYKTIKYPTKDDTNTTCHSGKIMAERKGDSWTVVNSKTKKMKCEVDAFGYKK
jgi:hypothetical protein